MIKKFISSILLLMLCVFVPYVANASIYYEPEDNISFTVNGVYLPIAGYEPGEPWDNCWTFAMDIYEKIWKLDEGEFWNVEDEDNILRNLRGNDLAITEENTKRYIMAAELGSNIRVEDGKGINEHSLILAQKDSNGFTVYHGNVNGKIYFTYYTYEDFAWHYEDYKYFVYISYPNAPAYKVLDNGECGAQGDNLTWELDSFGTLTISGDGDMVNRPSFNEHRTDIKQVAFNGNITSIGDYAFRNCEKLNNISIPDSVASIGSGAFIDTAYYKNSDNWENDVLYIGNCLIEARDRTAVKCEIKEGTTVIATGAFSTYNSELTDIVIPNGVRNICAKAFSGCSKLISAELPDSIETIEYAAFEGCSGLNSINIPSNVKIIEPGVFGYSGSILINVDKYNPLYSSEDGVLFNKDKTEILAYAKDKLCDNYSIPNSVTVIGEAAFGWCGNLKRVEIPNSVTEIKETAFIASALKNIEFPDSIISIGKCAFQWCEELEYVILGTGIELIDDCAFTINGKLTNVYYKGSEEQWNDINIIPQNFEKAEIHCGAIGINPPQIGDLTLGSSVSGSIADLIKVPITDTEYDSEMITAFYKDGVLVDMQTTPVKSGDEMKDIPIPDNSGADSAKVFIWSSLDSMKPLCEAKKIKLTEEDI